MNQACRSLNQSELESLKGSMSLRDRTLFTLGVRTGFRISELLSIRIADVLNDNGTIRETVKVRRMHCKGRNEARTVPLHPEAKAALKAFIDLMYPVESRNVAAPLFQSNTGERLSRQLFHRALKNACTRASIHVGLGKVASHSMRKTFVSKMYEALGKDLIKLQQATGHKSLDNLKHYLSVDKTEIENAIKSVK